MKVLYVAPYPPGHIRARSFYLPAQLLRLGHRVTVAYPDAADDLQSRADELVELGASIVTVPISTFRRGLGSLAALLRRRPMQAGYAWSSRLAQRLAVEVEREPPDIVHLEHLRSLNYGSALHGDRGRRSWLTVWDSVDCISTLLSETRRYSRSSFWRWAARLDLGPARRCERQALATVDRVFCASESDRDALLATAGATARHRPLVLPQGVDLDAFPFRDPADRPQRLVFSGAMGYHPNVAAALHLVEQVMPRVWARRSDVELLLVGPDAPRQLERRVEARCAGKVRFVGWVPSVQPHLAEAAVAAIPLRYGAGVQNKVLQSMACGTPIVTDPRSAEAVGAVPGEDVLVAESDEDFAQGIVTLLTDPDLRVRLARNARQRVEYDFSWQRVGRELERHYRAALAARG